MTGGLKIKKFIFYFTLVFVCIFVEEMYAQVKMEVPLGKIKLWGPKTINTADMVLIPAGEFWMGSYEKEAKDAFELCKEYYAFCEWSGFQAEMPKHKVYLDAYSIDKYEVTNAQYKRCVEAGKCKKPWNTKWYDDSNYANHPVVYVDWNQAETFCTWMGGYLPTEAQWEKAARGKIGNIWPWGNTWDAGKGNNHDYNGSLTSKMAGMYEKRGTLPVGSFENGKSPYGVYDMAGNVWEWVSDWYDEDYYKNSPEKNPKGPNRKKGKVLRILRGGSWYNNDHDDFRTASRNTLDPAASDDNYGFRCAKDAK